MNFVRVGLNVALSFYKLFSFSLVPISPYILIDVKTCSVIQFMRMKLTKCNIFGNRIFYETNRLIGPTDQKYISILREM